MGKGPEESLKDGVDQGELDYLVLETSGAADPRRLLNCLEQRFGPCTRARLDRVVALVDAELALTACWLERGDADEGVQRAQLSCADVVVLNKVDLVDEASRALVVRRLQELCPSARVLSCTFGKVSLPDVLDVTDTAQASAMSHESVPAFWSTHQDLAPSQPRVAAGFMAGQLPVAGSLHSAKHRTVEWKCDAGPVHLARLQELLTLRLPQLQRWLRRGKGMLWMAEDPKARWEWQMSGRLRYACRREDGGWAGCQPWTSLVLIFSADAPEEKLQSLREEMDRLRLPAEAEGWEQRAAEVRQLLSEGDIPFEVLDGSTDVVRFRLTGRERFKIPPDTDLSDMPYMVDVDAMNVELARLVSTLPGGVFLALGEGREPRTGAAVLALLWPLGASDRLPAAPEPHSEAGVPPPPPAAPQWRSTIEAARVESWPLLKRYFGHVSSCACGK